MRKIILSFILLVVSSVAFAGDHANPADFGITDLQYRVSETNQYIQKHLKKAGINQFAHQRDYIKVSTQQVIRENQDALYSSAVVDVSGGATIKVPEYPGYSIIQVIDMQNYSIATVYPGQSVHITSADLSFGDYVYLNARTRPVDGANSLDGAHKQQDAFVIEAKNSRPYSPPQEVVSDEKLLEVRTALIKDVGKGKIKDLTTLMGTPDMVDHQGHLYATAYGWGGLPIQDAAYLPIPVRAEGDVCSSVTIDPPPVNYDKGGFWSITTYNKRGWLAVDNAAIFNQDAVTNGDGTITVRFNCTGQPNTIETVDGFAVVLRMYMPTSTKEAREYLANAMGRYIVSANHKNQVLTDIIVPKVATDVPQFVAGSPLSTAYIEAVGKIAYLWGWPMVNMRSRHKLFSRAPGHVLFGGIIPFAPIGQLSMLSDYLEPQQRFITSPNQDVVYGAGFLSLDEQPVIIQVPDFGDRFWVYQVIDQRTDSYAEIGAQYNTEPGHYLLVGPHWQGDTPEGVKGVFQSSTNIGAIFPRVFQDDTAEDHEAIQSILNQIMVYPLSEYTGEMKTIEWQKLPTLENKNAGGTNETRWVNPETFFDKLPGIMREVPPLPGEEALYGWIQSIIDAAKNNPELKQALIDSTKSAEKEIISAMFEFRNNGVTAGNGWRTQKNAAQFGIDYFQRTATAKGNMFSNRGEETMYFGADFASDGQRLNGKQGYTVTFAKGQLPPVKGFWSFTLYNEAHFFAPNELNRFSLGTKNKNLVFNADGSLTIYVQADNPGKNKENNWLPAPKDENFSLYIRAYWPEASILTGEWIPPKIEAKN
ncbi:MAG: DUF1214 domain-containing protein [Desulfuromusa sp.]|nr:DUF1214 domain-containing protein [Desulfuromusa sp.]